MEHKALYEKRYEQFVKLGAFLDWAVNEIKSEMKKRDLGFEKFRESRGAHMSDRDYMNWRSEQLERILEIPTDLVVEIMDTNGAYKLKPAFATRLSDIKVVLESRTFLDMNRLFEMEDGFNESSYVEMLERYSNGNGYNGINDVELYIDLYEKMNKIQESLVAVVHTVREDVTKFLNDLENIKKSWVQKKGLI